MKIIWFVICVVITTCTAQLWYDEKNPDYEEHPKPLTGFEAVKTLFAADIYKELGQHDSSNFFVSPLSLQILLALLHSGAGGISAEEIAKTIRMPNNANRIQREFQKLVLEVLEPYTLRTANKIYLTNGLNISENYKRIAQNVFKSDVEIINFQMANEAATAINKWVEEKTNNNIKDLINENDISGDITTVLINTMYFNAKWSTRFNENNTRKGVFYTENGEEVMVDMMYISMNVNYYHNKQLKARFLELPYEGGEVTMTIVLPDNIDLFPILEEHYREILVKPPYYEYKTPMGIKIPKFQIKSSIDLNEILQNLGIRSAFTSSANFSGITDSENSMTISKSLQKTVIKVVEGGTTAAAASLADVSTRSVLPKFHANHPFIFIIRHKQNGILFVGRYTNPTGTKVQ